MRKECGVRVCGIESWSGPYVPESLEQGFKNQYRSFLHF